MTSRKRVAKPVEEKQSFLDDNITRIYMNHFIKDPNNKEPVITVQRGNRPNLIYAHRVRIVDDRGRTVATVVFDPEGLKSAPFHHVKAWIETDFNIEV